MSNSQRLSSEQRARLDRLGEQGVLSREQVAAVLDELDRERGAAWGSRTAVWEVLGYIGGALVLGGAVLLVGMYWENLAVPARVALLVAATLALVGAGLVMAGGPRALRAFGGEAEPSARSRIVSALVALASCTAALAVASGVDVLESLAASVTGLLVASLGYVVVGGLPVLLVAVGFSVGVVAAAVAEWFDSSSPAHTTGLVALGTVWTALAVLGVVRHRRPVLGAGVLIALAGAQYAVGLNQSWVGYGLTLLIGLLCFGGYLVERAVVLLALGVLAVTVAVPEAVWDWTGGALGGPVVVLLVGVVFLAASALGLRLRRRAPASDQR
ncbi:hypothetical protein E1161_04435 [Saccharopolyspora aridisoli]|uniref:DUF2157 domain-containing protein n=1 Tax=Saccharopolyspora aridisoli TaxID=2530385 RepID=A0A4V2Y8E9_9PSEU|nr:hypothetical protein [Saccharopolyspora aridisoli]TDC95435.1 hypothetical protein E1161_04435 [Saccharopolyspora aridisoli]